MTDPARIAETAAALSAAGSPIRPGPETPGPGRVRGSASPSSPCGQDAPSRSALRAAIARGRVARVQRGVFIASDLLDGADARRAHLLRAEAVLLANPSAVLSHRTAALVHGIPLLCAEIAAGPVDVTSESPLRAQAGRSRHRLSLPEHHVQTVDGLRVTSPARTAVDLACLDGVEAGVVALDSVARRLIVPDRDDRFSTAARVIVARDGAADRVREELAGVLSACGRRVGGNMAREAIRLCHPAAESPLESVSRYRVLRGRIPHPEVGQAVRGADGRMYWADLLWRDYRVLGEADGLDKYASIDVVRREKLRQEALEQAGWTVVRWTWAEITRRPDDVLGRLWWALGRRPERLPSSFRS